MKDKKTIKVLLDVFNRREDLQKSFPEVSRRDYTRLLDWALAVCEKLWDDSDYENLIPYIQFFKFEKDKRKIYSKIERFSVFQNTFHLIGSLITNKNIIDLYLRTKSMELIKINFKKKGNQYRFDVKGNFDGNLISLLKSKFLMDTEKDGTLEIENVFEASHEDDPAHMLTPKFKKLLDPEKSGKLLEVGSRKRSFIVRRDFLPSDKWSYVGIDILKGENVDIIGDAHKLSEIFSKNQFDAVMAYSVLEHLLMPWKFIIELNKVMKAGGFGYFTTHQSWPIHDAPWDFWRFSDQSWKSLLNKKTGFEIIEARMGEPTFTVPKVLHEVTNFGEVHFGYLASHVIFRKINETKLEWPVNIEEITQTQYPV